MLWSVILITKIRFIKGLVISVHAMDMKGWRILFQFPQDHKNVMELPKN